MSFKSYKNSNPEAALQRMTEQKKRKVLFTSHVANFQKFNRPFMRMLRDKGYEVHYASMGEEEILDCDKSFVVPFSRNPLSSSNVMAYMQLKKIIDREQYDIIHTHTPMGSVVTRLAAIAARKKKTKVIYTAHGFHFFKGAPLMNWAVYYPIERYMARHTDTLITINEEDYVRAKSNFETNVRYVPGVGIDLKNFDKKFSRKQRIDLRKEFGIQKGDFVLIYVAELSKRKNQLFLIRALAGFLMEHPDAHLILPGADSLHGAAHKLVSHLKLKNQIHFPGYRSDVPHLLKASNIAVSASKQEGLPVNIMEAMCLGLPVIATNCRGNRDLIEEQVTGYIVGINDVNTFAEKVKILYEDPELRDNFGIAGKNRAAKYSLNSLMPLLERAYYE